MSRKFSLLTRQAIRQLCSGQSLREHGIAVERLKNGDLCYRINIMVDRERIHRVIGRESEGVTREQAERAIEALRTKAREGRLELPRGRKVHRTFADCSGDYLQRIEHHLKYGRNYNRKLAHVRHRLTPFFKSYRPDQITDLIISQYVSHRQSEGASPATINRELSTLSHFLNRCLEWGFITRKPKIYKCEEPRKQVVVLSNADQKSLLDAAIDDQDPYTWLFVVIALCTGMRHGEILRIKWQHIDFANRRIHIGKAKAGQREQPIPPYLSDTLKDEHEHLGRPQGWLFPTQRADPKQQHRQQMNQQFRRAVVRAKLDPKVLTPHVLRHTAITELVKAGVDLPTIQRISGHKTLEMVMRYTQITDNHVDQSIAKLGTALTEAITPKLHRPI